LENLLRSNKQTNKYLHKRMLYSEKKQADILIVDDEPNNLRVLNAHLHQCGYKVRPTISGQTALKAVDTMIPDLILLDINMPIMDGYEVCQKLKESTITKEIPIIFLSANIDVIDKIKGFQVGAIDYITKPFEPQEVLIRVETQLKLQAAKKEIKQLNEELEAKVKQRTAQLEEANEALKQEIAQKEKYQNQLEEANEILKQEIAEKEKYQNQLEAANEALKKEIAQKEKYQKQLLHKAFHDDLTGLPNRALFMSRLEDALMRTKNQENYLFAVLFLDCDRFKVVNDSLGHLIGDQLLVAVATRLESCLQLKDVIARFGGDEFTILLDNIKDLKEAEAIASQINKSLEKPFSLGEHDLYINASIGIVLGTKNYQQADQILRDADTAMYCSKELGKARYTVFDQGMHKRSLGIFKLETNLRQAMELDEFVLFYQPIICLSTGKIISFEALLRWQHREKGLISPVHFIPKTEETGLIVDIGIWVLNQALSQLRNWQDQGLVTPDLTMSVNLSVKQFSSSHLLDEIDKTLAQNLLDGSRLNLEITESAIMENPDLATRVLQQMRMRKVTLSIDDFGCGYSSLSYLHRFPVNNLKIDRSFISRIGNHGENSEIIQTILTLAHQLKLKVIAEGIETAKQFDHLRELGCEFGQGYFFSKPLDANSVAKVLKKKTP